VVTSEYAVMVCHDEYSHFPIFIGLLNFPQCWCVVLIGFHFSPIFNFLAALLELLLHWSVVYCRHKLLAVAWAEVLFRT